MRLVFRACWSAVVPVMFLAMGCASNPPPRPPDSPILTTNAKAPPPVHPVSANVGVSDDLAHACNIQFSNSDTAPKFDTATSELLPEDRSVLEQIARCVTTGPLKGRALRLVGRADPRGESEYNMTLGEHRADSVKRYLGGLGVDAKHISETSRGKLDASGTDESSWRRDRRVDVMLQ